MDDAALPSVRPPMPDGLRTLALDAIKRHQRRPCPPMIATEPERRRGEADYLTCPYQDQDRDLWVALVLECFGTRSYAVGQCFLRQLASLCPEALYEGEAAARIDEEALSQALAIVCGLKVRDEAQAAHAAQLVALHFAAMKLGKTAGRYEWIPVQSANALGALVKGYGRGLETLGRLKGGGRKTSRQTIKVVNEKHIHFHDQRSVNLRGGGGRKSGGQPHEANEIRAREASTSGSGDVPALRCEGPLGQSLPSSGDEGEEAVPVARRIGDRGAQG